jgi:hypothetical protein
VGALLWIDLSAAFHGGSSLKRVQNC